MTLPAARLSGTVGELVARRLKEVKRSAAQLAEALEVPPDYVDDLIDGSRRPPLPGRTDIYERMTPFLRLGRNDLASCAISERASAGSAAPVGPEADVRKRILELCEPETARVLERRRSRRGNEELVGFIQRLLDITQGAVRRLLDDQVSLRISATQRGTTYMALRLHVLEFLDATPDTLTAENFAEFVHPRIAHWDVDLETRVLRVAMRAQEPRERSRRVVGGARAPIRFDSDGEG